MLLGPCREREPAERRWRSCWRQERRVAHCIFTYPWGIHFPGSLGIRCIKRSMAAYSEIKHNTSRQAGKQAVFSERNAFLYRSQVKYILLDLNHILWVITVFKNAYSCTQALLGSEMLTGREAAE